MRIAGIAEDRAGPGFPDRRNHLRQRRHRRRIQDRPREVTLRAKLEVEDQKNNRKSIIVTELPYGIIRKTIQESAAEAVKKDLIKEISAINDESGRQYKCRIVIDLKRDADPELVMRQLYQYTPCEITVSMINIALVNRQPRTMGLKEMIQHFIAHRKEVIVRRTKFKLKHSRAARPHSRRIDLRGHRYR